MLRGEGGKGCLEAEADSGAEETFLADEVTLGDLEAGRGGRAGAGGVATRRGPQPQRSILPCWRGGEQAMQPY